MMSAQTTTTSGVNDPSTVVIRRFKRQDTCIGCRGQTFLHETNYERESNSVEGRYECQCGYIQHKRITGAFVDWYREVILKEDLEAERKEIEKAKDEIEKQRLSKLPKVKIG